MEESDADTLTHHANFQQAGIHCNEGIELLAHLQLQHCTRTPFRSVPKHARNGYNRGSLQCYPAFGIGGLYERGLQVHRIRKGQCARQLPEALTAIRQNVIPVLSSLIVYYVMCALRPEYTNGCTESGPDDPQCRSMRFCGDCLVVIIAAVLALPFWQWLAAQYGQHTAWVAWSTFNACTNTLLLCV